MKKPAAQPLACWLERASQLRSGRAVRPLPPLVLPDMLPELPILLSELPPSVVLEPLRLPVALELVLPVPVAPDPVLLLPRFVLVPVLLLPVVAPVPVLELPMLLLVPVRLLVLDPVPVPLPVPAVVPVPDVLPVPLMPLPVVLLPVVLLPVDAPVPPVPELVPLLCANATPPSASAAAAANAERVILLAFILCPSCCCTAPQRAVPSP